MALFWALLCMLFSASSDLLFKFYTRKPRSIGYFVAIVGLMWLPLSASFITGAPVNWPVTLVWGVLAGLCSIGGNLFMLDAMHYLDAGVCSTIYRLNLVPAALGAAFLLGESVSTRQWCGVLAACLAILFFLPRRKADGKKLEMAAFCVMLAASLLRAGLGLCYKYGFSHGADREIVVAIGGAFWILGGIVYAWMRERRKSGVAAAERRSERRALWLYGLGDGVLVAGITITLAKALALGQASRILTVTQMSFLLTALFGVLLLKEKLSVCRGLAVLCGVAAVVLMTI